MRVRLEAINNRKEIRCGIFGFVRKLEWVSTKSFQYIDCNSYFQSIDAISSNIQSSFYQLVLKLLFWWLIQVYQHFHFVAIRIPRE